MGGDANVMVSADEEVEDTETICGPSGGNPRGLKTLAKDKIKKLEVIIIAPVLWIVLFIQW